MPYTLFGRLLLACAIILCLFFIFISIITDQLIWENVNSNKQEQLHLQNYLLLNSAQMTNNSIQLSKDLQEPRFDNFESGLYGFISDRNNNIYWHSYSAKGLTSDASLLQTTLDTPGQSEYAITAGYFIYRYAVRWEVKEDQPEIIIFTVLEDSKPTLDNIHAFQQRLRFWLIAIGLTLIVMILIILRWGTRPLRQLADNLKQIEQGDKKILEGNYPIELQGITRNLNELIDTERRQRERYYSTLTDLAHSLKTPLAVIQAELNSQQPADTHLLIVEQIQRMDDIIKHQLQRSLIAAPHQLTDSIAVDESIERLINAMSKVYAEKCINFELNIPSNIRFKGDKRDLLEIAGNLLDNACKACRKQISVVASSTAQTTRIEFHDDGTGIAEHQRQQLIERGQRADTRHQGQGIGLDVVRDIVESYQGKLFIEQSPLGGACVIITFPSPG